jgi:Fe-Mn family superoxide dismutase
MIALSRRTVMLTSAAAAATAATFCRARADGAEMSYPFKLPPLPYATNANEPFIDAQTMELHHGKHHAAYVANLNAALSDYPQVAALGLPAMLAQLAQVPEPIRTTVRNNGGGHVNHTMFWQLMGGKGGDPNGTLASAIARDFGSVAQLKEQFNKAGAGRFGSGWVMVLVDRDGKLSLTTTANQDSPLLDGKTVLFGNDVWEHAYYLKYQNRRADYLVAWWNVVDWDKIAERYQSAMAGTLGI